MEQGPNLQEQLRHILWIGGSVCAGKTSIPGLGAKLTGRHRLIGDRAEKLGEKLCQSQQNHVTAYR